jgi:hypothetical protein
MLEGLETTDMAVNSTLFDNYLTVKVQTKSCLKFKGKSTERCS